MMNELISRYPCLESCKDDIIAATDAIIDCYKKGGKVLLCGNGGSCADCDHIVGELMKGFLKKRPLSSMQKEKIKHCAPVLNDAMLGKLQNGLPAISLPSIAVLNSAFCNDIDPELIYAQSVLGLGKPGDVLLCISTSGNAKNVDAAVMTATAMGLHTIGLTGKDGGLLAQHAELPLVMPEKDTYLIQENHICVYHLICAVVESELFDA